MRYEDMALLSFRIGWRILQRDVRAIYLETLDVLGVDEHEAKITHATL